MKLEKEKEYYCIIGIENLVCKIKILDIHKSEREVFCYLYIFEDPTTMVLSFNNIFKTREDAEIELEKRILLEI